MNAAAKTLTRPASKANAALSPGKICTGVTGSATLLTRARYCGNGYLYCSGPSCQLDYGPACDANVRPSGPDTSGVPRNKKGPVPYGQAIYHCERYGDIALSYDDGPFEYTEDLLNLLSVSTYIHLDI